MHLFVLKDSEIYTRETIANSQRAPTKINKNCPIAKGKILEVFAAKGDIGQFRAAYEGYNFH